MSHRHVETSSCGAWRAQQPPDRPGRRARAIVLRAAGRSRRHAEQRVDLRGPEELTGVKVPVPEPHRLSGQGKTASPVTGMERLFDTLPLGNVGGDAASRIGCTGMVAQRELDRDVGMEAIGMGRIFLIFHRTVPLQHRHIVGAKRVGDVLGENLVIGIPDNLIHREMKELFKSAIDEKIPAIGVFHIDHGGGVVDDILQELLVPAKRILRAFAISHALEGAGHTNDLTGIVPDGLATGAEPAILSCLGEEPVFHIIGITALDMGRQGSEDAIGIFGMKPGTSSFPRHREIPRRYNPAWL